MVIRNYVKGIAFVLLILSAVMLAMAANPDITVNSPADGSTVPVNYVNVTVTLNESGTALLKWGSNANVSMIGAGTSFYYNETGLSNGLYTYIVYANDTTPENWSASPTKTVTVNVSASPPAISTFNPTSPTYTTFGNSQTFNVTANQIANITWKINGNQVQFNESVLVGTKAEYINNSAPIGTYTVTATASNGNGTSPSPQTWEWHIIASQGPPPVSGLTVAGIGATWINWTWVNPTSGNFNYTTVKINSTYTQPNTTNNYFNFTNFASGTLNRIDLQTVDTSGTVNSTVVSNQAYTLNTPTGSNVIVNLLSNLVVTFSQVISEGNTSVSISSTNPNTHTFQKIGNYYDISTNATSSGNIIVELGYSPPTGINESNIKLYHWGGTSWDELQTFVDTTNKKIRGNVTNLSIFVAGVTPKPSITKVSPSDPVNTSCCTPQTFKVKVSQEASVKWYVNSELKNDSGTIVKDVETTFTYKPPSQGNYNVLVNATNVNGSDIAYWNWTVQPKTYYSGDRIWDERKHSRTYTWDVYSFSGFYYNLDDDLGNESLTITNIDSSLAEGDITYSTSPEEVEFAHSGFGDYQVIGFMADKYFAGYTANSTPSEKKSKSTIGSSQLHKVLLDDDDKRTVSEGGTLTLKEGYVLKITAVDIGAGTGQVWITLLKDGAEVDTDVVAGNEDYYYTKKVGSVSDLPVIAVHFDSVFRGREVNAVFIRGVFQISESYTQVKSGSKYGVMEVDSATSSKITMKNDNTVDLSAGNTIDLMGNLKIKVADNSTLRFGLTVERTGTFEARGTIYDRTYEWTPMNFGLNIGGTSIGFYYDMDEDIGNEKLWIDGGNVSGTSLQSGTLQYSTSPQEVSFEHDKFGSYQVIGFMADKYFAGYTAGSKPSGDKAKSTIGSSQLHRVLLDDDEKRTVSEGGTLTLKEGYVLKITAVDIGAGQGQVWITLLKDGGEVDTDVVAGNEDYYYTKKVGSVSDLPVISVHFDSVFRGKEVNAVFIRGVFQISESYTQVKSGSKYGAMEVTGASSSGITMENDNTIDLSQGSTSDVMGNIKFRVADSSDLRFYPFVEVTPGMLANQLVIDAPAKANSGDNITIKVTAGGSAVDNASVSIDSEIGKTDGNGVLNYTLPKTMKGSYNITATKLGYEKASSGIEIAEYIDYRLTIDIPAKANQFETLTILVKYNSTAIGGAAVKYDNETIGTTDSSGTLNHTPQTSGMHTISASKSGYITVFRDIEVIAPFSEYKALDINVTPALVFPSQKVVIRSNITNVGTKADTLPVDLIINGSVVNNRSVALGPHETKEINFTGNLKQWVLDEVKPGNYTVEILGQKTTMPVKEEPLNLFLVAGIITILGAVLIFIMTSKEIISIEALKAKLKMAPATNRPMINRDAINRAIKGITSKFQKK